MKQLITALVIIPWLAFSNDEGKWREIREDEIEGIRKFEILYDSPIQLEMSAKTTGHSQSHTFTSSEAGYTLTVIAPEVRGQDVNLTIKLMGHTTRKTYSMSFFNEQTNLHDCKPELSDEFLLTVGKYQIIVSHYLNRTEVKN